MDTLLYLVHGLGVLLHHGAWLMLAFAAVTAGTLVAAGVAALFLGRLLLRTFRSRNGAAS